MINKVNKFAAAFSGLRRAGAVCARSFPSKPVTLMVPLSAGGWPDPIAPLINGLAQCLPNIDTDSA
jgi:tripartite-type tricarboxylate transporter receptor subunit TctC